jgi:hydrogenase maturation protease
VTVPGSDLAVIGVGNVLRGDDAIGVRVIESLRAVVDRNRLALPARTRLVDGGTLGLDLLQSMRDARAVVLVDAMHVGGAIGTVSVLRGDEIPGPSDPCDDTAPGAVSELISVARLLGWLPGDVVMVGVEVADIDFGIGISPEVADALPIARDAVMAELHRMDLVRATGTAGGDATARMAGTTA